MKNRCKENPCCGDPHSCTLNTRRGAAVEGLVRYESTGTTMVLEEDKNGEYVRFDQAEAIIAAKDERLKDCRSLINEFKRDFKKLEDENAKLTAQIAHLEKIIIGADRQLAAARKALGNLTSYANSMALAEIFRTHGYDSFWNALKEACAALEAKP